MNPEYEFTILPYHEVFYIESLLFCTESALASRAWLNRVLKGIEEDKDDFDDMPVLNQLQNIINQGGAISKFFWPPDKRYKKRGEVLRNSLGVTAGNPLESRRLRNLVEHYDEYLDDYLKTVTAGVFTPHYFGPTPQEDGVPRHSFKAYYYDTATFVMLGEGFLIDPLIQEIDRIHKILVTCQKGGRLPANQNAKTQG